MNNDTDVEVSVSLDEPEKPIQAPPKRQRGRPKATPSSWEFDAPRAPPPDLTNLQAAVGATSAAYLNGCNEHTSQSTPPKDDQFELPTEGETTGQCPEPKGNAYGQKKQWKTPNDNLRERLDSYVDEYLSEWYSHNAPPPTPTCSLCDNQIDTFHRCSTCLGCSIICSDCLVCTHRYTPTHHIKTWDGSSWEDDNISRKELKFCLFLGHGGKECRSNADTWNLLVGDVNGFTPILVRYCTCEGHVSRTRQLLQAGLFPCSQRHPESAITFPLLEMYDLLTTVGRTSWHKYYSVLSRFTKPGFPSEVDDRYCELMWTHRRYMLLSLLRQFGHIFPAHPDIDVHPGDQAVDCVCCPRPGINFEWHKVLDGERAYFRIWISYDGNTHNVWKCKKVDQNDVCLTDDKAYFAQKDAYKLWTESVPQPRRAEKPDCNHHKAGNVTSSRWVGRDVTGVDFFKGERFAYADHALGSLIAHILKRRSEPLLVGITYNVWCHYIANFRERLKLLPSSIAIPADLDVVGAVPKWHSLGHKRVCYIRFSLDNMQYVGRLDGEGVEQFWAHLNQMSGSTSEQGAGFRTDSVNNIVRQWNDNKNHSAHEVLPPWYDEAKRMLAKTKADHNALDSTFKGNETEAWEKQSMEPVKMPDGKQWTSPVMDPVLEKGKFKNETAKAQRKKEEPTARTAGRRPGTVRWISDGIELEHYIRNYNKEAEELGDSPTPRRATALNTKRLTLRNRIQDYLKRGEFYMRDLLEPDASRLLYLFEEDNESKAVDLGIPSSYKTDTIKHTPDLLSLAEVELELRRAMCNESLETVKRLLGVKARHIQTKRGAGSQRGLAPTTRAEAEIRSDHQKVQKARWRYTNSYEALLQLGPSDSDKRDYKELKDSDLVPLQTYFIAYAGAVGHGDTTMPWIWRSSAVPNMEQWQVQALKTEWFRSRERYKRWEEQLILVKREMVMAIRSFLRYEELWKWKSERPEITLAMRAYASSRAKFYAKLAHQMLTSCREQLYDKTVELKWSSDWLEKNVLDKPQEILDKIFDEAFDETHDKTDNKMPDETLDEMLDKLIEEDTLTDDITITLGESMGYTLFGPGGYERFLKEHSQHLEKCLARRNLRVVPELLRESNLPPTNTLSMGNQGKRIEKPKIKSNASTRRGRQPPPAKPPAKNKGKRTKQPAPTQRSKRVAQESETKEEDELVEEEESAEEEESVEDEESVEEEPVEPSLNKPSQAGTPNPRMKGPAATHSPTFPLRKTTLGSSSSASLQSGSCTQSSAKEVFVLVRSPKKKAAPVIVQTQDE